MLNSKVISAVVFILFLFGCSIDYRGFGFNVIVITIDALRADHMSCYGYKKNTTPNIAKLAERGVLFENAISQSSWTKASMASFFTSLYPHNHKAYPKHSILPEDVWTMAEEFKSKGYHTFAIQANGFLKNMYKVDQGFDEYHFSLDLPAQQIVDLFNEFLVAKSGKKFFAYLHFMEPHVPYYAPEEYNLKFVDPAYEGVIDKNQFDKFKEVRSGLLKLSNKEKRHVVDLYDAEIRYADENIKRMFEKLEELNLQQNTIVVIMSDHGEEFWDHNGYEHGHTMYKELLHVPLIIINPKIQRPKRIKQVVRLIDVYPTLMDILGFNTQNEFMGQNLAKIMYSYYERNLKLLAFSEGLLYGPEKKSIQSEHFKLIKKMKDNSLEFYELENDSKELHDLAGIDKLDKESHVNFKLFQEYLKEYGEAKSSHYESSQVELDEETINQLKALGYVN